MPRSTSRRTTWSVPGASRNADQIPITLLSDQLRLAKLLHRQPEISGLKAYPGLALFGGGQRTFKYHPALFQHGDARAELFHLGEEMG